MQKQKKQIDRALMKTAFTLLVTICLASLANAQEDMITTEQQRINASGDYVNYIIPKDSPGLLYLEACGADGAVVFETAGRGATIQGWVKIGAGASEIPVGSTIRFMVGQEGECKQDYDGKNYGGCGGGGGTAIAFKKPGHNSWQLLIVSGGGGGSGESNAGRQAETGKNGSSGKNAWDKKLGNGGIDGKSGRSAGSIGGGGAYYSRMDRTSNLAGFSDDNRTPEGGGRTPGDLGVYGFGGGGFGMKGRDGFSGGGGGGYSGGGAGIESGGGGGGGSYSNEKYVFALLKKQNGNTSRPQGGFIKYRFAPAAVIHPSGDDRKCLHPVNNNAGKAMDIKVSDCGKNASEWLFDGRYIRPITNRDKCLDLDKNNNKNGTKVQLYDCNSSNAQRWVYDGLSKQVRYLQNWKKCLDLESMNNGNIRLWDCQDRPNQQWEIDGATTAKGNNRVKTVYLAKDNGKCMDLYKGETANNRTNIQLWDCHSQNPQKWLFDGINIRYYGLQYKCLDLDQNNTSNGTNIHLWDCNGTDAQRWVYDGMTSTIRYWKNPDKCLVAKGANIEIRDCNGNSAQQWKMKDADTPFGSDKVVSIRRLNHKEKCMDVGGGTANDTNIQLRNCTGNTNQQWTYDGLYLRYKKDPTKCLDLKAADTHNGNNIQLYACNSTKAQRWLYDETNHLIRYADNWNKCLHVDKNRNDDGTNIQIYDCRKTDAQQWIIK